MSGWKMVPTVATAEMVEADIDSAQATTKAAMLGHKIPFVEGLQRCYSAMLAAAPPFVVTDAILDAAIDAEREAFHQFTHEHAGGPVSHADGRRVSIRAAIEAALEAAAKGDV